MNSAFHAPQRSTTGTTAPATAILADARRAECVRKVFEQKYEHLCLLAIKYLKGSEVFAEDIVVDVFEAALNKWPQDQYEKIKNLEAFIARCIINRSKNMRKRNKRMTNLQAFSIDTFSIPNPMAKFDLDIDALVKMLPAKQGEAFGLYCKGYTHQEIAVMMKLSGAAASKNLVYYAKLKLQPMVDEGADFDPDDRDPSNAPKKQRAKTNRTQTKPITNGPGFTPRIKDLVSYLKGNTLKTSIRKAILHWLVADKFAIDIISGLNYELKQNNTSNIETRLIKSKDSIRERLFNAPVLSKRTRMATTTPSIHFDLNSINRIEENHINLPIVEIPYPLNNTGPFAFGDSLVPIISLYPRLISSAKKPLHELLKSGKFNWGNFPDQRTKDLNDTVDISNCQLLSNQPVWIIFKLKKDTKRN